ncbi:hypothetical protein VTK26DRAFT_1511 [Humicola hyalothermophila]
MRAPTNWPTLALLVLHAAHAHGSRTSSETGVSPAPTVAPQVCESRTINYITHSLPQQCLRTSWTGSSPAPTSTAAEQATTAGDAPKTTWDSGTAQLQDAQEELAATSFMSFEEWKEMMLRKSGQDPAKIKSHRQREPRGEREPGPNNGDFDSFGDEGEISLEFDALAEKVSGLASPPAGSGAPPAKQEAKEEQQVLYDDGKTQYYRSKDAGKTCKERFSFSSFDAGATVKKTSPGAKNAKAILVENKDSYMLLECRSKNKFVIVELSDDILVDTIVLANFEFFSSMIRHFRVSASDRYPVKPDKWVDLGTFEARNSRDIQAFLVEHPQIYTKYIRIEFLTHYGNEFYCPVSLLRVHGTRMLDTWKEPAHDDEPEQVEGAAAQEPAAESHQAPEQPTGDDSSATTQAAESVPQMVTEMGLSPWSPIFQSSFLLDVCALSSPTTVDPTPVESDSSDPPGKPAGKPDAVTSGTPAATKDDETARSTSSSPPAPPSPKSSAAQSQSTGAAASPTAPLAPPDSNNDTAGSSASHKPSDVRADVGDTPSPTPSATTSRNRTTSSSSAPSASPTVQESFFKTVTKRLQHLESNTSLSLQYIEEQSRFLQEVLLKMERKHITRIDSFLDTLNKTVLSELHNVRTQYDQIWQSTVIALETQRDQSQREIVALTSRLNVLADEVVFQKRMAILQSVLLLACLVLVIFSRGGLQAALDSTTSFPSASFSSTAPFSSPPPSYRGWRRGPETSSLSGLSASPPPEPRETTGTTSALAASAFPRHLYSAAPISTKPSPPLPVPIKSAINTDKTLPLTPSPSDYSRESTPVRHRRPSSNRANNSPGNDTNTSPAPTSSFNEDDDPSHATQNDAATATTTTTTTAPPPSPPSPPQAKPGRHDDGHGNDVDASMSMPTTIRARSLPDHRETSSPFANNNNNNNPVAVAAIKEEEEEEEDVVVMVEKKEEEEGAQGSGSPPAVRARSTMPHLGSLKKPLPALPEDPS